MKKLNIFINETINQSLRDKLLDLLDDPNLTDKVAQNMLNIGRFSGRMGMGTGKMAAGVRKLNKDGSFSKRGWQEAPREIIDNDEYGVGEKLRSINVNDNKMKEIVNIFINNNMMDRYIKYLEKPWFTTNDLIAGKNIYSVLRPTKISPKVLKELGMLEDNKNNVSQGKFEILFKLFLNDLSPNNQDYDKSRHGDIQSGGYAIEVKGKNARAGSQKAHPSDLIYNELNRLTKRLNLKFDKNALNSIDRINSTVTQLYTVLQDDRKVFDIIYQSMLAQFNSADTLSEHDKNQLTREIFNKGTVQTINDTNGVTRLLLSIQLLNYYMDEGYDYLLIIDPNNGDYDCIPTSQFSIMNIFYHPHIGTENGSGAKCNGTSRENFCYIEYK